MKAPIKSLGFDFAIGTSGTIVTLAELAAERTTDRGTVASGLRWLSGSRLEELIEMLAPLDAAERSSTFHIDARRASTILAGAIVLSETMAAVGTDQVRACDAALRDGIVQSKLDSGRRSRSVSSGSVRRSSVMSLAEQSHEDMVHAKHVAALALRIFDQTAALHMLNMGERELLEYAALLHEAGMHVSYQSHHKHSFYLISHAGLRGFTADQVAVVANVARYHRKSAPSEEHPNFAQLSRAQREVVRKLAAILRVADALDRGRRGAVRDVGVVLDDKAVTFRIRKRGGAELEHDEAAKKAKYFGAVFERKVRFTMSSR